MQKPTSANNTLKTAIGLQFGDHQLFTLLSISNNFLICLIGQYAVRYMVLG